METLPLNRLNYVEIVWPLVNQSSLVKEQGFQNLLESSQNRYNLETSRGGYRQKSEKQLSHEVRLKVGFSKEGIMCITGVLKESIKIE